jgi:hypothetical protein
MQSIMQCSDRNLSWKQPTALKQEYVLLDAESLVGTLRFRSAFGTLATGESADGGWTFKRVGFWKTRVSIREAGSETEIASFVNNTWSNGGTLEFTDGRRYPADSNFWMTRFTFATEQEAPLVAFEKIGGILHFSSRVTVHASARHLQALPIMVMLGWYLTIMMHKDSAAAAAG